MGLSTVLPFMCQREDLLNDVLRLLKGVVLFIYAWRFNAHRYTSLRFNSLVNLLKHSR